MTPAQQGAWIVALALHRGQRHARKQGRKWLQSVYASVYPGVTVDWDAYCGTREARGNHDR